MKAQLLLVASAFVLRATAEDAPSPFKYDYSIKPGVLSGSAENDLVPALKYSASAKYDWAPWKGNGTAFAKFRSEGAVATEATANSENLFAELHAGGDFFLGKPAPVTAPPPAPGNFTPDMVPPTPEGRKDFGFIEGTAKLRFETDQSFENYNVTYGPHIGYVHRNSAKALWPLVPLVQVDFQRVEVLHSEAYEKRGIDEEAFWRYGITAEWNWQAGEQLAQDSRYLRPLGVYGRVSYYQSYDLPKGATRAEFDESTYYAGGLNYAFTKLNLRYLRSAFITVAHGRLPPTIREQTMVFVGVTLGPKLEREPIW